MVRNAGLTQQWQWKTLRDKKILVKGKVTLESIWGLSHGKKWWTDTAMTNKKHW